MQSINQELIVLCNMLRFETQPISENSKTFTFTTFLLYATIEPSGPRDGFFPSLSVNCFTSLVFRASRSSFYPQLHKLHLSIYSYVYRMDLSTYELSSFSLSTFILTYVQPTKISFSLRPRYLNHSILFQVDCCALFSIFSSIRIREWKQKTVQIVLPSGPVAYGTTGCITSFNFYTFHLFSCNGWSSENIHPSWLVRLSPSHKTLHPQTLLPSIHIH